MQSAIYVRQSHQQYNQVAVNVEPHIVVFDVDTQRIGDRVIHVMAKGVSKNHSIPNALTGIWR